MKDNIRLLYGFSLLDQFMIVIPLLVPYTATKGITMTQFMELQAIFAIVIVIGQLPTGVLSDLWGRKKTLLVGSALKALGFTLLPFWNDYSGFLVYHLTMGVALATISGGDVALLYESSLAANAEKSQGTKVLGNAKLAGQMGVAVSALLAGVLVTFSYEHLLWANAVVGWLPVLLVLALVEPPADPAAAKKRPQALTREAFAAALTQDTVTRLVFLNIVAAGVAGLVMVWTNQKYWQATQVPLAWFGMLYAAYSLLAGLAGRSAARFEDRFGWRPILAVAGAVSVACYFGMAAFVGWAGIVIGFVLQMSRALADVLFLKAINERITSATRATVLSLAQLITRASFALIGPMVGYGIDGFGLPFVLYSVGILFFLAFVFLLLPLVWRPAAT